MLEINIQKIKFWLIIAVVQLASFGLGFFAANNIYSPEANQSLNNYTTNQSEPPQTAAVSNDTQSSTPPVDCPVKGNISSKSKIYHVQGGSFFDRTTPEMCFNTETEAQAAGFTKSSR